MLKWVYRILRLFFCPHKWQDAERNTVGKKLYTLGGKVADEISKGDVIVQKCTRPDCGARRKFKLYFD